MGESTGIKQDLKQKLPELDWKSVILDRMTQNIHIGTVSHVGREIILYFGDGDYERGMRRFMTRWESTWKNTKKRLMVLIQKGLVVLEADGKVISIDTHTSFRKIYYLPPYENDLGKYLVSMIAQRSSSLIYSISKFFSKYDLASFEEIKDFVYENYNTVSKDLIKANLEMLEKFNIVKKTSEEGVSIWSRHETSQSVIRDSMSKRMQFITERKLEAMKRGRKAEIEIGDTFSSLGAKDMGKIFYKVPSLDDFFPTEFDRGIRFDSKSKIFEYIPNIKVNFIFESKIGLNYNPTEKDVLWFVHKLNRIEQQNKIPVLVVLDKNKLNPKVSDLCNKFDINVWDLSEVRVSGLVKRLVG